MKHYTSRLLPLGVAAAIVVGVLIGNFYSHLFSGNRVSFINTSSNKINDLMQIISDRYVDTINMGDFVERTMPQILKELDPHSTYISAKDVEASMQDLKGSFSGIGVQFTIYDDTVRIVRVIEGGPSERVGLRAGDCIVSVDQKPYVGKVINNDETMKRLKGAAGSTVRLGIKRHGEKALQHFSITRGAVPVKSVDAAYMMDAQTGYIRINTWGDNTYPEVLSSLASLNAQGLEQLVIDLRGNLGGYLQAAVQVANEFLPKNRLIVYNEGVHFPREDFKSDGRGAYQTLPLVVLVDETSASASEIFAGAMQDNDRATLIGRRTFGKGLVQVPIEFRDGSMLRHRDAACRSPSPLVMKPPTKPTCWSVLPLANTSLRTASRHPDKNTKHGLDVLFMEVVASSPTILCRATLSELHLIIRTSISMVLSISLPIGMSTSTARAFLSLTPPLPWPSTSASKIWSKSLPTMPNSTATSDVT